MQASVSMLQIELIKFWREVLVFIKEESRQEVRDTLAVLLRELIDNFLEDTQVRAV